RYRRASNRSTRAWVFVPWRCSGITASTRILSASPPPSARSRTSAKGSFNGIGAGSERTRRVKPPAPLFTSCPPGPLAAASQAARPSLAAALDAQPHDPPARLVRDQEVVAQAREAGRDPRPGLACGVSGGEEEPAALGVEGRHARVPLLRHEQRAPVGVEG